jgi:predicted GIY-YIG superfamily endonuclease
MIYVYVLISEQDGLFYTGCTRHLRQRFELHNTGKVASTAKRILTSIVKSSSH